MSVFDTSWITRIQPYISTSRREFKVMRNQAYGNLGPSNVRSSFYPLIGVPKPYGKGETAIRVSSTANVDDIYDWCEEMFGPPGTNKIYRWRRSYTFPYRVFLKHEEDVTLFMLKWGVQNDTSP
jgi:hypothetical protein